MAIRLSKVPAPRLTATAPPVADRYLSSSGESELIERANRAYRVARREVFDPLGVSLADLTPRQRQVVVELELAEEGLAQWRAEQRQSRALREGADRDRRISAARQA